MEVKPTPQSRVDRLAHGSDLMQNRLEFLSKAALNLILAFAIVGLMVWAGGSVLYWGPGKAQVLFAVISSKLIPDLGLPLPCLLPSGLTWISARTLARHNLPGLFRIMALLGAIAGAAACFFVYRIYEKTGQQVAEDRFIRGAELLDDTAELNQRIQNPGAISLGGVHLPDGFETKGLFISGSTGSGKTVAQVEILEQIRIRGDKAIIYDPTPEFISLFWREGDIILNPFDERSTVWCGPWDEIKHSYDFRLTAESLIELEPRYPNFSISSRAVLAAIIEKTGSLPEFLTALRRNPSETETFLKGTSAEGIITSQNPKGGDILLSIIRNACLIFNYLRQPCTGDNPFSLRDWVDDDADQRWIFLPCPQTQLGLLRPLISLWIDLVANQTLSLTPCRHRRIWLWLEELPSLCRLQSLVGFVCKSRKYGGCWMLAVQDPAQLAAIYGPEDARTLLQNCGVWLALRSNSREAAEFLCRQIGEFEAIEVSQGISVGPGDSPRDGATYSARRIMRPTLLPAQLQSLDNLNGYLLISGPYPRTKVTLSYKDRAPMAPAFILDQKVNLSWKEDSTPKLKPELSGPDQLTSLQPVDISINIPNFKNLKKKFVAKLEEED